MFYLFVMLKLGYNLVNFLFLLLKLNQDCQMIIIVNN